MSLDVGEVTERLKNELCYDYNYELCSYSNLSITSPTSQLILQPFCCFTYVTAHSPTLLQLLLCHKIFNYVTWRAAHEIAYINMILMVLLQSDVRIITPYHCIFNPIEMIRSQLNILWLKIIRHSNSKISRSIFRKQLFTQKQRNGKIVSKM